MDPRPRQLGTLLSALLLAACSQPPLIPAPVPVSRPEGAPGPASTQTQGTPRRETRFDKLPGPPGPAETRSPALEGAPSPAAPEGIEAGISLNLDQLPLPEFVQLIYGEILKRNVQIDPKVAERKDLVTLRSGQKQTPAQVERVAKQVLQTYGVAVVDAGGLVRVVPETGLAGYLPEIQRGAALPQTPQSLRPQFYLIELTSVRQNDVLGWLKTMFQDRLKVLEDPNRNAILLSGAPDTIRAALDAIGVLDQPTMAGHQSLRISPSLWSADDFARRLSEVLTAEGYSVAPINQAPGGVRYPIVLLPVPAINAVLVFANSQQILDHVQEWAARLDQPAERGIGRNFFTYSVQNTDASDLAATLGQVLSGTRGPAGAAAQAPRTGGTTQGSAAAPQPSSSSAAAGAAASGVVVDKASNTLIFQGNPEDYPQVRSLLTLLDRPPKEALIEVTVAEVQLTGNWQLGVEWGLFGSLNNGNTYTAGTAPTSNTSSGGLPVGNAGFTAQLLSSAGQVRALVNALATDNRATILSSPRVMARNGETANIEVGQEVPIVTSQQTSIAAPTTAQGVLQSVEYRTTGVLLKVTPVIHSSDQIDLDVSQEVSQAETTSTGVNNSPTFGTRKVSTKLSLKNGSTVLLGGMISSNNSTGESGIPWLKDLPLLGNLFKATTVQTLRTEVIVLITPYIVSDDFDAQAVTKAFQKQLGDWSVPGGKMPDKDAPAAPTLAPAPPPVSGEGKEGPPH